MANNKIKHSKYRNSGILFELLVRQITSDTLVGKESPAVNILKEYFSNSELANEYKLYNTLISSKINNESKASILLEAACDSYKKLNKTALRKQKYNLIKEIRQHYNLENFFKAKINNYKVYAATFVLFESYNSKDFVSPDTVVKNKVVILEHLTHKPADEDTKDAIMEKYIQSDKGTRFLTYKMLVEKFNKKYNNLNSLQKDILREYINNITNTNNLKEFINERFTVIKKELKQQIKTVDNKVTMIKLAEVIKLISPIEKNENVKDDDVLNLLQYSQLTEELKALSK